MNVFFNHKNSFSTILKKYFSIRNETKSIDPIAEFFQAIKKEDFAVVLDFFRNEKEITENFRYYIHYLFHKKPFTLSLTEASIISENSFLPELRKRLLNIFLPAVDHEESVGYMVDYVSVHPKSDLKFLQNIHEYQIDEFFEMMQIHDFITKPSVRKNLVYAANVLTWRAIGNAMDSEVMNMVPEFKKYDNPFLALQEEMDILNIEMKKDPLFLFNKKNQNYKQIKIYLEQCNIFIDTAFKNASKYGISSKINQSLLRIKQQIHRITDIIYFLLLDKEQDILIKSKEFVFKILEYKSKKNNIVELFDDSTRLISHLITNHTAETGTHYISSNKKEYLRMFWKASGGGVVVASLCVLKLLYSYIPGSDFSHAFLYAFNYAMGFIIIYLLGYTLATKQPAMTAATMAKVLSDGKNSKKNYLDFAHLVSKLFRSQFIAFVGNVLWAFPFALAIIYGLDVLLNMNLATEKSTKLLLDLDPVHSKAIFHACIAGVFLFFSGIISGNVGNNSVYFKIPQRIAKNPRIKLIFGEKIAQKISEYYSKNWAGIVSNFWFGVFLGVTAPIGHFFGLDLDIRHITFAAGNLALGVYGKDFSVDFSTFAIAFSTVFLIGFFNFLVSFGLSMFLALRSRKINLGGVKEIIKEIFRYFMKYPLRFFLPIRSILLDERAKELVENSTTTK